MQKDEEKTKPRPQSDEAKTAKANALKELRQSLIPQRQKLPIWSARQKLIEEIRSNQALVIVGETGSGKTTQIPQFIYNARLHNDKIIGITQPRRVAAITLSQRVANEIGTDLGRTVGYSIRFDDKTSKNTKLKYMTDGMLLREAVLDPMLKNYSVIIIDEAHERTIQTDILLGLLKGVQKKTNDLKIIVMSATLDAELFANYFGAKVLYVEGRQFPVDIMYTTEPQNDYLDAALTTVLQVHLEEPEGDILVFLTGSEEIQSLEKLITERALGFPKESKKLIVCPIYAALPAEEQMKVFEACPPGCRKVILATNIAETSITINGIKYVVDTGVVKSRGYNPNTGISSLFVMPVSKAQARQRAGRAGREQSGICYRLYTEDDFFKFKDNTIPEILRSELSGVVLQMKALGIKDVYKFEYIQKPSRESLIRALESLFALGALTKDGEISEPLGKQMAELPLDPPYAKILLMSKEYNCTEEALTVISMLSVESDSVFFIPKGKRKEALQSTKKFTSNEGDHFTLLNVYSAYISNRESKKWCFENFVNAKSLSKAKNIRDQLKDYCIQLNIPFTSCENDTSLLRRCFVTGFFTNAAVLQPDGEYKTTSDNKSVLIHPSSILFGKKVPCVLYNEMVMTKKQYLRNVMIIDREWLFELAPHFYEKSTIRKPIVN